MAIQLLWGASLTGVFPSPVSDYGKRYEAIEQTAEEDC